MKKWYASLDKGWIAAAVLPLIGLLPAFHTTQVINTADGLFHVHRILAMTTLMANGDLYPRWIPWFHLGYGYPVFNFYAPAASYLGGLLGLAGISAPLAYNLIAALCWMGGSMGMYGLGRRFLPGYAAMLAAALWAYAPSRLQDVWNIGNLSGFIGTALLPWLFYALARCIEAPSLRRAGWLGLVFGGVILAHQPTTVLAGLVIVPGIPLWCWWRGGRKTFIPRLLYAVGGLALGIGLAMIFLLPMAAELGYIKVSREAEDISSVLLSGFLRPDQLFVQPSAPDLGDTSRRLPDTLGLVGGILSGIGILALLWKRKFMLALAWGAALLFGLYLLLDVSYNFWLTVPLLDQLRFPARVLRLAVIFLSLLGGATLLFVPTRFKAIGTLLAVVVVIGAALPTMYPSEETVDYAGITPSSEIEYELATYSFGGTSYDKFRPIWASSNPTDPPFDVENYARDPMQVWFVDPRLDSVQVESIGDRSVRVNAGDAFELSFRHFYFPGWRAELDGQPTDVYPKTDYGLMTVKVPSGEHTIMLYRDNTPVQHLAALLSLVSLVITLVLLRRREEPQSKPTALEPLSARLAVLLMVGIITFAVLNMTVILPTTDWFRLHSPPDTPAAMQVPVRQPFGDAYELLGYTLDQNTAPAGGTFSLTLFWRALRPLDHVYQPRVQLVNPAHTGAWAANQGFFVGAEPVNHRPETFTSDVHITRIFADAPPYVGSITVQLIDPQTDAALRLPDGSDTLTLPDTVRITAPNPAVERALDYTIGGSIELWRVSVESRDGQIQINLDWHVSAPLTNGDVRVFIHGLDADGSLVEQTDGPPLAGDYAPQNWLAGQNLPDHYTLPDNPDIRQIALGMYVPGGDRLPVTQDGQPVPDNRILLPVE